MRRDGGPLICDLPDKPRPGANPTIRGDRMHHLLTQQEAAAMLRLSERTLERWRVSGGGPAFTKLGRRVLYREPDLFYWVASNVVHSTSERRE